MEQLKENLFKLSYEEQDYEYKFGDWRDQWCKDKSPEAYFGAHDKFFDCQDGQGKYSSFSQFYIYIDISLSKLMMILYIFICSKSIFTWI